MYTQPAAMLRLLFPVMGLVASLILNLDWAELAAAAGVHADTLVFDAGRRGSATLSWLLAAFACIRFLNIFLWNGPAFGGDKGQAPRLLVEIVAGVIWLADFLVILTTVFDQTVPGLITTSGVAVAIIGFALKNVISDLFSGIAVGIDRPFRIGDWIEMSDGTVGKVMDLSWRATGLLTESGIYVAVPNSRMAEVVLRNFNRPSPSYRDELDITLGYEVSVAQAERILLGAAEEVAEVAALGQPTDAHILRFTEDGVQWRLRYWVPHFDQREPIAQRIKGNVLRNLHFAGISVPVQTIRLAQPQNLAGGEDLPRFLASIDIFRGLRPAELDSLAAHADTRLVPRGEAVVRQGAAGSSLFLVREGLLDVSVAARGDGRHVVGQLQPGSFFGELSLLTGEPRSATVTALTDTLVCEITKQAMEPLLRDRPEIAEQFSIVLAARQAATQDIATRRTGAEYDAEGGAGRAAEMFRRIRTFFGLAAGQPQVG